MSVTWRKTPKFVMRESCIRDVTRDWEPGSFLEPGAGTGTMTRLFLDRGFHGTVYDLAEETRAILRTNLAEYKDRVQVVAGVGELPPESVDYLLAFEVLEHIPDDLAATVEWAKALRPGGRLLVSTPAHQRKYSSADALVGHVRRYEKDDLTTLLGNAGFERVRMYNYAFPLGNVTRLGQKAYDRLLRRQDLGTATPAQVRSIESGIRTDRSVNLAARLLNERTLAPVCRLQRLFYNRELGDGWVATAVKA